jgi:tetratricopeptide (TPR) repeat protein
METRTERSFVRSYLPWLVAAGAVVFFSFTLNRSLSLMNLPGLARVSGLDWRPVYQAPLYYAVTLPIRWLPSSWQMLAANGFSLICASLALALLARSVTLLPHDRTREQRVRDLDEWGSLKFKAAWAPVLVAVLVCGLQLSFWEQATAASGEMLDLLLFAYLVRCLLEYRRDEKESWLWRLALVYGLATANNWAMIGLFPCFLVALVWIMGRRFFRYAFVVRALLWGLAGLLLYLLLPLLHLGADPAEGGFWTFLKANLASQKAALRLLPLAYVLLASIAALLSLFLIGIRWPNSMGDVSPVGYLAFTLAMYLLHGGLLALCLWVAFDPRFSPRVLIAQRGLSDYIQMLPTYYAGALAIGYFTGYLLLLFGTRAVRIKERTASWRPMINLAIVVGVGLAGAGVPINLLRLNLPQILTRNSPELDRYGQRLADSLPPGGAVVLSDDRVRLLAVRAALGGRESQYVLLDTTSLSQPGYHRHLKRRYGPRLPEPPKPLAGSGLVQPFQVLQFLLAASAHQPLYYLHPSFGYYFEYFYARPHQAVYELQRSPTNTVDLPPLGAQLLREQEAYWQTFDENELLRLKPLVERYQKTEKGQITPLWVAGYYSRARDHWGVQLAINGQREAALRAYKQALVLNPKNVSAFMNVEWTDHWAKTGNLLPSYSSETMNLLRPYLGNWDLLLALNGPVDEPAFRTELAQVMGRNGLGFQAARELQRVLAINPRDLMAALLLGNIYVQTGLPDQALALVAKVRSDSTLNPTESRPQLELIGIEAWAYFAKGDQTRAERLLKAAQQTFPQLDGGYFILAQMYMAEGERQRAAGNNRAYFQGVTNTLAVFEKQIKAQPGNVNALINIGGLCSQLEDYPRANALLSQAVQLSPSNQLARLNRAITCLRAGLNDEARADYDYLVKAAPTSYRAYYGLTELAYRRQDWTGALENCELYLRYAPASTSEYEAMKQRLAELRKKAKR